MIFHKVKRCFGMTLWKSKTRHVELWACFSDINPHSHPHQTASITPIFGWSVFYKLKTMAREETFERVVITPKKWFKSFTVETGWVHGFLGYPLIFINSSTGSKSAAENIKWV